MYFLADSLRTISATSFVTTRRPTGQSDIKANLKDCMANGIVMIKMKAMIPDTTCKRNSGIPKVKSHSKLSKNPSTPPIVKLSPSSPFKSRTCTTSLPKGNADIFAISTADLLNGSPTIVIANTKPARSQSMQLINPPQKTNHKKFPTKRMTNPSAPPVGQWCHHEAAPAMQKAAPQSPFRVVRLSLVLSFQAVSVVRYVAMGPSRKLGQVSAWGGLGCDLRGKEIVCGWVSSLAV